MPAAQIGGHGLEVDVVRFHRLIIRCSGDDLQRVLRFLEAPGFEIVRVTTGYRPPAKEAIDYKAIEIRYPAFRDMRIPPGPAGETVAAILNVFGDSANGTKAPEALVYKVLVAKLAGEMGISSRTANDKLNTLIRAGHLKERYGTVLFPKHLMIEETEETEEADKSE